MKNLNLNAYGVTEMSRSEMKSVNGGWWPLIAAAAVVGFMIVKCSDPEAEKEAAVFSL